MWVVVRQDDWVGGEDVLGVVGPFRTEAAARARLEDMKGRLPGPPYPRERLWLMPVELPLVAGGSASALVRPTPTSISESA
ncbi:hypothetical protein [Geodermatophilus sabuli]|uniref:Uncharacterized protein n=1 Tax=Geodermatophilus sabuli TaxID=1564158 RepID=A0A285EBU9_9ACTN|nr:hypothetical protein [Geodermatophilus sabuli]MBB3084213.1 hypothetical protein [Geodermatophilus sabuli]SNX96515.1 hypothetical protein SAMN06893097_104230 [Geodermatophilus sabuli]